MKLQLLLLAALATAHGQTGTSAAGFAPLDASLEQLRVKYRFPAVAAAVMYDGELAYNRAFGLARRAPEAVPAQPETLFRIASVSKPFTAVTLLKLQESGKLRLDDLLFDILPEFRPLLGDPRMLSITVRQLLQHTAGWDSSLSGDPMFPDHETLVSLEASFPPTLQDIAAFWLSQPLDFTPGTRYAYSNFGYAVAGLVIERVSGMSYADAVRCLVLQPLGITRMQLAQTLAAAEGEAAYESLSGDDQSLSIFSEEPHMVPIAYGAYAIENMAAHGGWLAQASDLVRFFSGVEKLLRPDSWQEFVARPSGLHSDDEWYGLGVQVYPAPGGGYLLMHDGAITSTCSALVIRDAQGNSVALIGNAMFSDEEIEDRAEELALDVLLALAPALDR